MASIGASEVRFINSYGKHVDVAYVYRDFSCQEKCEEPWDVRGWISLDAGETEIRSNSTKNPWFYYYAEAVDGAVWSGPFVEEVTGSAFEKCTCESASIRNGEPRNPYHEVGFVELDMETWSGVEFVRNT
jgi:Protein of unknown function (DUF1036)